ncbi:MAG: hypothetical protein WAV41_00950 [Microgenomates group bacterium]
MFNEGSSKLNQRLLTDDGLREKFEKATPEKIGLETAREITLDLVNSLRVQETGMKLEYQSGNDDLVALTIYDQVNKLNPDLALAGFALHCSEVAKEEFDRGFLTGAVTTDVSLYQIQMWGLERVSKVLLEEAQKSNP